MNYGFVRVAAATPKIKVAECEYNRERICEIIDGMADRNVKVVVFPELSITGYTCGDLFWQSLLLRKAKEEVVKIAEYLTGKDMIAVVGLPFEYNGMLYNVAAVLKNGKVLGLIPKKSIPNYSEFYELRHFQPGFEKPVMTRIGDYEVPFGMNILFQCSNIEGFTLGVEICEDLWVPMSPSLKHVMAGATLIANLSASDEVVGKDSYRRMLVSSQSAKLICGYIYADAGEGESTTDLIFASHNIIAENGRTLGESELFENQTVYGEIDLDKIRNERRRMTTFSPIDDNDYLKVKFEMDPGTISLERFVDKTPFVPNQKEERDKRCEEILTMQSMGLKKRLEHTGTKHAVLGLSGGLDSTLALIVTVRAFDFLRIPRENVIAVTMPGFGTTGRTYQNALELAEKFGVTLQEISIKEAAELHFKEIGHDITVHDVVYENVQARQRTMLLMNLANRVNGFVIGTGDLSELALGWATYNGDHMSMYAVNSSVPKTLVRHLVHYYADICEDQKLSSVLNDILDTPVSPELLPPQDGEISQKTEDLVGPYELHDFFLYYILRFGYEPKKVMFLAQKAFGNDYESVTILKWLRVFYRRFFAQQYKRSCLPDGPKVGTVAVSPRGDLRLPSDACVNNWITELDHMEQNM